MSNSGSQKGVNAETECVWVCSRGELLLIAVVFTRKISTCTSCQETVTLETGRNKFV